MEDLSAITLSDIFGRLRELNYAPQYIDIWPEQSRLLAEIRRREFSK